MNSIRKMMVLLLAVVLIFGALPGISTRAVAKPGKPVITLKASGNGSDVVITIKETKDAKGYKIVMKAPGGEKYKAVKTLKKDGTAIRTYTVKNLAAGEYSFKVKAYTKTGSKTVYGSYSKAKSITVGEQPVDTPTWIGETQTYTFKGITFEFPAQNNYFDKIVEAGYADRNVWDGTVIWMNEDGTAGFIYLRNTNTTKTLGGPDEPCGISDDEVNAWLTKIYWNAGQYVEDPKKLSDLDGNGIITALEADLCSIFTIGVDMNGLLEFFP